MTTFITDGGRRGSSHPNEKLDCIVRALALAIPMSYDEAHATAKRYGRKDRHRFYDMGKHMSNLTGGRPCSRSGSVGKFAQLHPFGRFIIRVSGHAFALIDGVAYDAREVNEQKHVKGAWRIEL